MDEMLCQLDGEGELTFILQDAGGDVCAAAIPGSGGGGGSTRVAAQYSYDAYGNVSTAEAFEDHPPMHAGHKGLFADRLDAGVVFEGGGGGGGGGGSYIETARFVTFSKLIYQNRNRAYAPGHGRFLQMDPNASAMAMIGSAARHGMRMSSTPGGFSIQDVYGDGGNLYQYIRSEPFGGSDPLGLYDWGDGAEDALDIIGLRNPLPGPADFAGSVLSSLVSEYAARLEWDVEWATDWSASDDEFTRKDSSWIQRAFRRGLYEAFDINLPFTDEVFNPLDLFFASGSGKKKSGGGGTISGGPRRTRFGIPTQKFTWRGPDGVDYSAIKIHFGGHQHPVIKFIGDARKKTYTLKSFGPRTNSDTRDANKFFGKPGDYNWETEFGFPCTWHHDHHNRRRMYLVPKDLHDRLRPHIGDRGLRGKR